MAFAFAAADVLLEVDAAGAVAFAAGALRRFGAEAAEGAPFLDLFAPDDQDLVAFVAAELEGAGRRGPLVVHNADGTRRANLSLLHAGEGDHLFATLSGIARSRLQPSSRSPSGLAERDAFLTAAEQELVRHLSGEQDLVLSIVRLTHRHDPADGGEAPAVQRLLRRVATALRSVALDSAVATDLGDGCFAVLHEAGDPSRLLESGLERALATAEVDEPVGFRRDEMALCDPTLTPVQACAALRHVLDRIDAVEGTVTSLAEALERQLSEATARVQAAKAVIDSRAFFVCYQPIVSLADGSLHHSEALTRLRSNEPILDFVT
ncbi:MAG: hypothetical protein ACOCYE_12445, partial [Pseudomonadota bacterium]